MWALVHCVCGGTPCKMYTSVPSLRWSLPLPATCESTEAPFPGTRAPAGERPGACQDSGSVPKLSADGNFSESLWAAERSSFPPACLGSSFVRQQLPLWSESSISSRTSLGFQSTCTQLRGCAVGVWPRAGLTQGSGGGLRLPPPICGSERFLSTPAPGGPSDR